MPPAEASIVATLGPACRDVQSLAALRRAGAQQLRINASHLRPAELEPLLTLATTAGFPLASVLLDLQGGKTRLGWFPAPRALKRGERLRLLPALEHSEHRPGDLPVDRPALLRALRPGCELHVDDGRFGLVVAQVAATGATVRARGDMLLQPRKGIACRDTDQKPDARLLPHDRDLLEQALGLGLRSFALSYTCSPAQLQAVRALAAPHRIQLAAKLEQPAAVRTHSALSGHADALWLCRGDLGAEVGLERLPALQHELLERLEPADPPLLIAGQVLHHLTRSPRPTRSEVCHAADLRRAGAAGFVLSDETAIGPHGPEAVAWLKRLAESYKLSASK